MNSMKTRLSSDPDNGIQSIEVEYGFNQIWNQDPYFSVTGHIRYTMKVGGGESYGMLHDDIARIFPDLKPYLKWHLCSLNKGPMHYIANALYWAGFTHWEKGNMEHLASTIVWGALPNEEGNIKDMINGKSEEEVKEWLLARYDPLMEVFHNDMRKLGFVE